MNEVLKAAAKAWLIETLKKAATSGGATAFEEILATLPPEHFHALHEALKRVAARRKITIEAKVVA